MIAQSHNCSFTALQEDFPRRAQVIFLDMCCHSPGGTRLSLPPARPGALNPNTQHGNNRPRIFQLPLLAKQQPSAADRLAPHQKTKLKQLTFLKTEIPLLSHLYLEAFVFNDKANLWILFTQMRSVDTPSPFAVLMEVTHSR